MPPRQTLCSRADAADTSRGYRSPLLSDTHLTCTDYTARHHWPPAAPIAVAPDSWDGSPSSAPAVSPNRAPLIGQPPFLALPLQARIFFRRPPGFRYRRGRVCLSTAEYCLPSSKYPCGHRPSLSHTLRRQVHAPPIQPPRCTQCRVRGTRTKSSRIPEGFACLGRHSAVGPLRPTPTPLPALACLHCVVLSRSLSTWN